MKDARAQRRLRRLAFSEAAGSQTSAAAAARSRREKRARQEKRSEREKGKKRERTMKKRKNNQQQMLNYLNTCQDPRSPNSLRRFTYANPARPPPQ